MERFGNRERWSDGDLLTGITARDPQAFSEFYRRYLPRVVAYLLRETSDREAAADLTAEVFAAVMLAASRYRPESDSALPWLLGIARNILGASRRRGRVDDRARRRLGCEPIELLDADLERTEALANLGSSRLLGLVEALPADERRAVKERIVHERPYAEIAADLSCSQFVVRKRVSRGLARLRKQLKES